MPPSLWRVRAADATHEGRAVPFERLAEGIQHEVVGSLDEVKAPGEARWMPVAEHPQTAALIPEDRRNRRRASEEAESDMTPMIDVTFQLLIFFMIAATYTVQKTLDLPSTQPSETGAAAVAIEDLEKTNVMVTLAKDGSVTVQGRPAPLDDLADVLRDAIAEMKQAEVVLDVEDEAAHEMVVQVLDAAGEARAAKVMFVSRVAPSGGS
jgi:biopolymer transport protein ExbD